MRRSDGKDVRARRPRCSTENARRKPSLPLANRQKFLVTRTSGEQPCSNANTGASSPNNPT
jgi:hypothetical protein